VRGIFDAIVISARGNRSATRLSCASAAADGWLDIKAANRGSARVELFVVTKLFGIDAPFAASIELSKGFADRKHFGVNDRRIWQVGKKLYLQEC
jgi:hypothetical protein